MVNVRNLALKILTAIEKDGAYSALTLNNSIKENKLSGVDASFLSALVYGALERQLTLDYILKQYSKIPLKKIELQTKIILRLGILQLVFMDKVPGSAAVNESVKLARKHGLHSSSGFINGVLRSVSRADEKYRLPKDKLERLSVEYSCPVEIVRLWLSSYGEEVTNGILASFFGRPRLCARVNTLKTTAPELAKKLLDDGVKAEISELDNNALILSNTGSVEQLKAFRDGLFYIQDLASQLCVKALAPAPGETVYDMCSAPGGKSFTAAMRMNDTGVIRSFDIYDHKLKLISENAGRLGITCVQPALRNAETDESDLNLADRVLCDVPCSGLGIIGRKPEIRYKSNLLSDELPPLQYKILCNSSRFLKPGGTLVYSTCTLNPAENRLNAERFLSEHSDFEPLALNLGVKRLCDEPSYMLTLFPQSGGTDGFFISAFRRKANL